MSMGITEKNLGSKFIAKKIKPHHIFIIYLVNYQLSTLRIEPNGTIENLFVMIGDIFIYQSDTIYLAIPKTYLRSSQIFITIK